MDFPQEHFGLVLVATFGILVLIVGVLVNIVIGYRRVKRECDSLEIRVQERTAELSEANQNLKREMVEREQAELALRESEKLTATGRMAARIAHEINNPLAGIKNSFLLLKGAVVEDHPHFHYVDDVHNEIDRITNIVREMYHLYNPETEKPVEFELKRNIEDLLSHFEPTCQERGVKVTAKLPESSIIVNLPQGSLRQVMSNTLQNAIEASPSGGTVNVRVDADNDHLSISVADQGKGIPEENKGRIFEPFFTTKGESANGGLGLGLSISRSLMQVMGGSLSFSSNGKEGTVFTLTVPLTRK